jgi:hypothetical protein
MRFRTQGEAFGVRKLACAFGSSELPHSKARFGRPGIDTLIF